jgi:hypothetical protein
LGTARLTALYDWRVQFIVVQEWSGATVRRPARLTFSMPFPLGRLQARPRLPRPQVSPAGEPGGPVPGRGPGPPRTSARRSPRSAPEATRSTRYLRPALQVPVGLATPRRLLEPAHGDTPLDPPPFPASTRQGQSAPALSLGAVAAGVIDGEATRTRGVRDKRGPVQPPPSPRVADGRPSSASMCAPPGGGVLLTVEPGRAVREGLLCAHVVADRRAQCDSPLCPSGESCLLAED